MARGTESSMPNMKSLS